MTATDELRAMLDDRGVEYRVSATGYSIDIGPYITAYANRSDTTLDVSLRNFTPEQAIAATLGRGECHDKNGFDPELGFECTVCGAMVDSYMVTPIEMGHVRQFTYCPFCGRRVKVVDA